MTGHEVWTQSLTLLHYTAGEGVPGGTALSRRALGLVNQAAAELWYAVADGEYPPLTDLSQPLPLTERIARTVLPYGVAMLAAQALGDTEGYALCERAYAARRPAALCVAERMTDTLPEVSE